MFRKNGNVIDLERWDEETAKFEPSVRFRWEQDAAPNTNHGNDDEVVMPPPLIPLSDFQSDY